MMSISLSRPAETAPLSFLTGYGEGYLAPVPEPRYDIVDGVVGWLGQERNGVCAAAFKTQSTDQGARFGWVYLQWEGVVPASGPSSLLASALRVRGWTDLTGVAAGSVQLTVRAFVGSSLKYYNSWLVAEDRTANEKRTQHFDKSYFLANGPSFYANEGRRIALTVELKTYAWSSGGEAATAIQQYGIEASATPDVVQIRCR